MSVHRRVEARNRGLARVSRLTSLTLSGGLVLSGGFAALAAHAYSGHARRAVNSGAANVDSRSTALLVPDPSLLTAGTTTSVAPLRATPAPTHSLPTTAPATTAQTAPPVTYPATPPTTPIVSSGS